MAAAEQSTDIAQLARQVQALTDRAEITELVSRLGRTLDEKRFEDFAVVFSEDVTGQFPGATVHGRDTLAEMGRKNLASFERVHHVITNVIVDLDGDAAAVRANLVATHIHRADVPTAHFDTGCVYSFDAVRTAAGWRLSRVELRHVWSAGTVAADVLEQLSPDASGGLATTPKDVLDKLDADLRADPVRTAGVEAVYAFELSGEAGGDWWLEARDGDGAVHEGRHDAPTVTVRMSDAVFVSLGTQQLDGATAYFNGQLSAEGDESKLTFLAQIFGE